MALRAGVYAGLPTERPHPGIRRLDLLGPLSVVRLMAREDARAAAAVSRQAPAIARAAQLAAIALSSGGRLLLLGAGTSGRLCVLEAAECPPTFGTPPDLIRAAIAGGRASVFKAKEGAEDDARAGAAAVSRLRPGDVAVGVAASGITPFVRAALSAARRRRCHTVLITSNGRPPGRPAEIVIAPQVGPEVLAGSTRLKSGTAAKLVLNMLTTTAMIQLGKVYDRWMVDLKPTNRKLRLRAQRLVCDLGRVSPARAGTLLKQSRGSVKAAVLMARRRVNLPEARRRLSRAHGFLRLALEEEA